MEGKWLSWQQHNLCTQKTRPVSYFSHQALNRWIYLLNEIALSGADVFDDRILVNWHGNLLVQARRDRLLVLVDYNQQATLYIPQYRLMRLWFLIKEHQKSAS